MQTGDVLPEQVYTVTRADLVRYAGASGDQNPIHWSDRVATSVGLPGVIAHGMYTMALAARALDTWAGGPGKVRSSSLSSSEARDCSNGDSRAAMRRSAQISFSASGVNVEPRPRPASSKGWPNSASAALIWPHAWR